MELVDIQPMNELIYEILSKLNASTLPGIDMTKYEKPIVTCEDNNFYATYKSKKKGHIMAQVPDRDDANIIVTYKGVDITKDMGLCHCFICTEEVRYKIDTAKGDTPVVLKPSTSI